MVKNLLNIFLVDDDEDDRELFQQAILETELEINLRMFESGSNLIKYLHKPDTTMPDVLFLDLNMPNMNGLECLKKIKEDIALQDITVIIYSTSSSERDIEATFLAGANIYINKPANFKVLKKVLEKVLKLDWQYQTSTLNRNNFLFRF